MVCVFTGWLCPHHACSRASPQPVDTVGERQQRCCFCSTNSSSVQRLYTLLCSRTRVSKPWPLGWPPVFVNKVLLEYNPCPFVYMLSLAASNLKAELNSCHRDHMASNLKYFLMWTFKYNFADFYSRVEMAGRE